MPLAGRQPVIGGAHSSELFRARNDKIVATVAKPSSLIRSSCLNPNDVKLIGGTLTLLKSSANNFSSCVSISPDPTEWINGMLQRVPGHDFNPRRKLRSSEVAFKRATAGEAAVSLADEKRMASDLPRPVAWPTFGPSAATTAPDIEYALSAGVPPSAILFKLVTDVAEVLDSEYEPLRALLRQAAALLRSGAARRRLTERGPARAALAKWKAKRVASHINDNLDKYLPLGELARFAGLSNSHFSRAFKGAFGKTPHAFIICRRVERARQEMLECRVSLSQFALSCGFTDQAHLARTFRRETGLTPSEWRRANLPAVDRPHCDASAHHQGHDLGFLR